MPDTRTRNRRQKMESIYGAGFWGVCHGPNVGLSIQATDYKQKSRCLWRNRATLTQGSRGLSATAELNVS